MIKVSDKRFREIVSAAIDDIPSPYSDRLQNVAFIVDDEPTPSQSQQLGLRCDALLFGLYEGLPLPQRMGATKLLPDKITLFKRPLEIVSADLADLKARIQHTVWHEVAHYYGLDHAKIHEIESRNALGK